MHDIRKVLLCVSLSCAGLAAWIACVESSRAQTGFELNIATTAAEGSAWDAQLRALKTHLESRAQGQLHVRLFLGGQRGGDAAAVRAVVAGDLQACVAPTQALASIAPELSLLEAPYLFANDEEADRVLDGRALSPVADVLHRRGVIFGAWFERGYRSWFTSSRAIRTLADLRTMRMRTRPSRVEQAMYEAWGSNAQPLALENVLFALQSGRIDGFDDTMAGVLATSFYPHIRHLSLSEHAYDPALLVYSKTWIETLPPNLREALTTLPASFTVEGRARVRAQRTFWHTSLEHVGVVIHPVQATERAQFAARVRGVPERIVGSTGAGGRVLLKALRAR